jgi:transketolase
MTQTASTDFPALERDPIDKLAVDTIRTLCMDAVQAANSGHPGTPMALAPVLYLSLIQHLTLPTILLV